jgi:hypothetical protein
MSHNAVKLIQTDVSSYVQDSPINNRKDAFVSSVIVNGPVKIYPRDLVFLLLCLCILIVLYALFCIFCFHRAS